MFAVVEMSGTQFKVSPGEKIIVDRMKEDEDAKITIDKVLLFHGDKEKDVKIGDPYVKGAVVEGKITRHFRGEKVRVFKMKRKKRYKRTQGFKALLTEFEITSIKG